MRMPSAHKWIVLILLFLYLTTPYLFAQVCDTSSFQNVYYFNNLRYGDTRKVLKDSKGNNYMFGTTFYDEHALELNLYGLIIKTTKRGTPLWAKAYGHNKDNILEDFIISNENEIICCGTTKPKYEAGNGWIFKADTNGNLVWVVNAAIDASSFTRIIQLSDGGFIAAGIYYPGYVMDPTHQRIDSVISAHSFLLCVNADGTKRWFKEYYDINQNDLIYQLLQLKDQSILIAGSSNLHDHINHSIILKIDASSGSVINSKTCKTYINKIVEKSDQSIRLECYYETMELNKDFTPLWHKKVNYDLEFYNQPELIKTNSKIYNSHDTSLYFGYLRSGFVPILFKVTDFKKLEWAKTYNTKFPFGKNSESFATAFTNGRFGICGRFLTYLLSTNDPNKEENQTYVIETGEDGITPCSSDYPLSVNYTPMENIDVFDISIITKNINGYFNSSDTYRSLIPRHLLDCYSTSCCKDTSLYSTLRICEGNSSTLPDGTSVSSQDIYTSVLHNAKGCDSIIFTSLIVDKKIKPVHDIDTCMNNSMSIDIMPPVTDTAASFLWQDGSTKKVLHINQPGKYSVKVSNQCGNITSHLNVLETCTLPIYLPNAFSPNHDNRNDVFRIINLKGLQVIKFSIYNKFGQNVFTTSDDKNGWDGTYKKEPQNAGIYVYDIVYKDLIGKKQELKGSFILVR